MLVYGINPIIEALRADRVVSIRVSRRADDRIRGVIALAGQHGVSIRRVDTGELDRLAPGAVHQGVVGELKAAREYDVADLVRERCDFLMKIPMSGHIASLNVSVAAGVALFEAVRQRKGSSPQTHGSGRSRSPESDA